MTFRVDQTVDHFVPVDTDSVIHKLRVELTYQLLRATELHEMERVARIELASLAWKAKVLPLHNTRLDN